jgi:hypothetical protein
MKARNKFVFLIMFVFTTILAYAQPGGGGGGFGDEPDDNAPIDGGITLLVAAASIYGAKKAFDRKK